MLVANDRGLVAPRPDVEGDPCRTQRPSVRFEFQRVRRIEATNRRMSVELLQPHNTVYLIDDPNSGQRPLPGAESKVPTTQSA